MKPVGAAGAAVVATASVVEALRLGKSRASAAAHIGVVVILITRQRAQPVASVAHRRHPMGFQVRSHAVGPGGGDFNELTVIGGGSGGDGYYGGGAGGSVCDVAL
jgi:hypothetical protein